METIKYTSDELVQKFGSHYHLHYTKQKSDYDNSFHNEYLSKILGRELSPIREYENPYIKKDILDKFIKLKFENQYTIDELIGPLNPDSQFDHLYDSHEKAIQSARSKINKYINEIKYYFTHSLYYIPFVDALYKYNILFLHKKYYEDYLMIKKAVMNFTVENVNFELKKAEYKLLPENFPSIGDTFYVVSFGTSDFKVTEAHVDQINVYDFGIDEPKMPFTVKLKSDNGNFSIDTASFLKSDGEEFSVGMAGHILFKHKENATACLDNILNNYIKMIEQAKENNK